MRRAPRLIPAKMHWAWTWEPVPPSAPVREEWVIPPRHGPLALLQEDLLIEVNDVEIVVEVDPSAADPDQQREATAVVCRVVQAFSQYRYLTWQFLQSQGGQFVRNPLLLSRVSDSFS